MSHKCVKTRDSGVAPDSGDDTPEDSGIHPDATTRDTGVIDTGVVDSGEPADTGVAPDTGVRPDSGVRPDAAPVDTGVAPDTGVEPDAGVADTGVHPDAATDGGVVITDGGVADAAPRDASATDSGARDASATDAAPRDAATSDGGAVACGTLTEHETAATPGTNDTLATAEVLPASTGTFQGELQSATDADLYSFQISQAGTRMRIALTSGAGAGNLLFGVVDGAGSFIRIGSDPLSNDASREIFFPAAGTYYLDIEGSSLPAGNYCYSFTMTALAAPTPATLALPAAGASTTQAFTVNETGDLGYYRITIPASTLRPIVFNVAATAATQAAGQAARLPDVDTMITLWDPVHRALVAENDDQPIGTNSNMAITLTSSSSRDLWVIIDHYALRNSDSGEAAPASGLQTDVTLSIDDPISAATLPFTDSSHGLTAERSIQWYLVSSLPGNRLTIDVDGTSGGLADIAVVADDALGAAIAQDVPHAATAGLTTIPILGDRTLVGVTALDALVSPAAGVTGDYSTTITLVAGCAALTGIAAPTAGQLVVNEVLWDPASTVALGDANGDGARSDQDDEFVELLNDGTTEIDLSGMSIADISGTTNGVRFVFPCGVTLQPTRGLVIFGGGYPRGTFGYSAVGAANVTLTCSGGAPARSLCFNNSTSEGVALRSAPTAGQAPDTGADYVRFTFGSIGGQNSPDTSYVRCTTASPSGASACDHGTSYTRHNTIPGVTASFSPGTRVDGTSYVLEADICQDATPITVGTLPGQSTSGLLNDYVPDAAACTSSYTARGPDIAYSIEVPDTQTLTVTVTPLGSFDPAVYLIGGPASSCDAQPLTCLTGTDANGDSAAETVTYQNTTGAAQTVYIVVDGYSTTGGDFSLATAIAP